MAQGRRVWTIAFRNFINSLRPKTVKGKEIGKDYLGNIYFETPADPSSGKRKPTRWYDPGKGLDFEDPLPSEWQSWLRLRRQDPPTEEEVAKNNALAEIKLINATKIEEKRLAEGGSLPDMPRTGPQSFPQYTEYNHGDHERNKK